MLPILLLLETFSSVTTMYQYETMQLMIFILGLDVSYGSHADFCKFYGRDCQDYLDRGHKAPGIYYVTPVGAYTGMNVYCDMTTDGGGWLVFQKRIDGSVDFYRGWSEYQSGFPDDKSREYWLDTNQADTIGTGILLLILKGLLPLKRILLQGHYELRIDLTDFEGNATYAKYKSFDIGDVTEHYKLKVTGYKGIAGDSLSYSHGEMFSTKDRDNDPDNERSCAEEYRGSWWHRSCFYANLNGQYLNGSHSKHAQGIVWHSWKGFYYSLKTTEMKIRRV